VRYINIYSNTYAAEIRKIEESGAIRDKSNFVEFTTRYLKNGNALCKVTSAKSRLKRYILNG